MAEMTLAWLVLALLALTAVAVTRRLVWHPIRQVLQANETIAKAAGFYVRTLEAILFFGALAGVVGTPVPSADQRKAWQPMEYVWWVVNGLESVFWALAIFLAVYVVAVTILYAALGRARDE